MYILNITTVTYLTYVHLWGYLNIVQSLFLNCGTKISVVEIYKFYS
jgi:hypothetical protein